MAEEVSALNEVPDDPYGGYADCCGASEAEPTCEYVPPSKELLDKYSHWRKESSES